MLVSYSVPAANAGNPTLLILGDSISAAYGINSHQGWVQLLQQRLRDQNYPYQVINASISGATSHNGLNRLPGLLDKHRPDITIIALGGNDGLRGLSLIELKKNLGRMIAASQKKNSRVLLAGIRLPPNYGATFNQRFSTIFYSLAKEYKIPLLKHMMDQVADQRSMMQSDGIHPTAGAQGQLLNNIWSMLRPMLEQ